MTTVFDGNSTDKSPPLSCKLRFKDDEGKEYPRWESKTLGVLFEVSVGGNIEKTHSSEVKDENFCYPVYANSERLKGLHSYSDQFRVAQDCITVSGRGTLGVAHVRSEKFFPIVRLLVLVPKTKSDLIFFEHAINELRIFNESTGVPQLTAPQLRKYYINFPSLKEQQKVADCLTSIDDLIEAQSLKVESLKAHKKGLMQQLFPAEGETVPELRFPEFRDAGEWEEKEVSEVFKITRGKVLAVNQITASLEADHIYPVFSSQTKKYGLMGYYTDWIYENAITWTTDGANGWRSKIQKRKVLLYKCLRCLVI